MRRSHTGLLLCRGRYENPGFHVVTHPNSLMSQLPPPPNHLLLLLFLLLFTRLLFIPTSCSDVLKKFLTAAIAFHRCSLQLLTGAMLAVFCPHPHPPTHPSPLCHAVSCRRCSHANVETHPPKVTAETLQRWRICMFSVLTASGFDDLCVNARSK